MPTPRPFRGGPLHLAAKQGHQHVVEKLLAANADVEAQDTGGREAQLGSSSGSTQKEPRWLGVETS